MGIVLSFEIGCRVISSWVLFLDVDYWQMCPVGTSGCCCDRFFLMFFLFQKHPDEQVPYATLQWINIAHWIPATSNKKWNIYIFKYIIYRYMWCHFLFYVRLLESICRIKGIFNPWWNHALWNIRKCRKTSILNGADLKPQNPISHKSPSRWAK